jgi:hypothetical protein
MWHPVPTSLLLASHDAWLEEMRKESSQELGRPVRLGLRHRLASRVSQWLISTGRRIEAQNRPEDSAMPEMVRSAPAS